MKELSEFEDKIGYVFKDKNLLVRALTHTSYAYEHKVESYERLEFLGDSILEFISSNYLFENYKELSEGEMTKVRAAAVCEKNLYKIAIKHGFSDFLFLGKSEKSASANTIKRAIQADVVEAVIAAMFLDSNDIELVKKFVIDNIKDDIEYSSKHVGFEDYKTILQEKLQINGVAEIKYVIINEEGPDHCKTFTARVECNGKPLATGSGKSKKIAEMAAAKVAIESLKE